MCGHVPGIFLNEKGKQVIDAAGRPVEIPSRYLRLKVSNKGRTTAQGIVVSVTNLRFWRETTGAEEFDEEVMDLPVARYTRPTFELAPGAHRFLDVFSAWRHNDEDDFSFSFALVVRIGYTSAVMVTAVTARRYSRLVKTFRRRKRVSSIGIGHATTALQFP